MMEVRTKLGVVATGTGRFPQLVTMVATHAVPQARTVTPHWWNAVLNLCACAERSQFARSSLCGESCDVRSLEDRVGPSRGSPQGELLPGGLKRGFDLRAALGRVRGRSRAAGGAQESEILHDAHLHRRQRASRCEQQEGSDLRSAGVHCGANDNVHEQAATWW